MTNEENNDYHILKNFVFKTIFGRNESKGLLEKFLERLLDREVKIEQILNSEINKDLLSGKSVNVDVTIKTTDNTLITIEVQNTEVFGVEKRLKFYSDRLSSTTLKKGDDYCEVQKLIGVAILNHKIYKYKNL
ncbi:MAG: Rpn family recombination-promoting nuclease/putative transposase [Methanobrevibacter sp.]|jgi:predicted transposase/invertase (TIGR01784 family)|nr:Rpn family recombination-promoting nuclease/putative transposase [Candidatus Methanovirga aequatorialis]